MDIRRFQTNDAKEVSALIIKTLRISNTKDYPAELMEELVKYQQPENIIERAGWTHFYVAVDGSSIIGCGAIGPYWGKEDESSLFTIFVLPEYQGKGIGRMLINELLKFVNDNGIQGTHIFVELCAMPDKIPFYQKFGFDQNEAQRLKMMYQVK